MKAKYIMSRDVAVAHLDTPLQEALELLRQRHISGLPVIDEEQRVVGVFSQTDALNKSGDKLRHFMTSPAVAVDEETSIKDIAALMAAKDINRVPILRNGRLVGIVSRADVVRYLATQHAWVKVEANVTSYTTSCSLPRPSETR